MKMTKTGAKIIKRTGDILRKTDPFGPPDGEWAQEFDRLYEAAVQVALEEMGITREEFDALDMSTTLGERTSQAFDEVDRFMQAGITHPDEY